MLDTFLLIFVSSECRSKRDMPRMYPHANGILYALKDKGVKIAIASRSPTPDIANTFLDKLGIKSMFVAQVCKLQPSLSKLATRVLYVISKSLLLDSNLR